MATLRELIAQQEHKATAPPHLRDLIAEQKAQTRVTARAGASVGTPATTAPAGRFAPVHRWGEGPRPSLGRVYLNAAENIPNSTRRILQGLGFLSSAGMAKGYEIAHDAWQNAGHNPLALPYGAADRLAPNLNPVRDAQSIYENVIAPTAHQVKHDYLSGGRNAAAKIYEDPAGAFLDALGLASVGGRIVSLGSRGIQAGAASAIARAATGEAPEIAGETGVRAYGLAGRIGAAGDKLAGGAEAVMAAPGKVVRGALAKAGGPLGRVIEGATEGRRVRGAVDTAYRNAEKLRDSLDTEAQARISAAFKGLGAQSRKRISDYAEGMLPKDEPLTLAEHRAMHVLKQEARAGAAKMDAARALRREYGPLAVKTYGKPLADISDDEMFRLQRLYARARTKTQPIPGVTEPLPAEEQGPAYLHSMAPGQPEKPPLMQPLAAVHGEAPPEQGFQHTYRTGHATVEPDPERRLLQRAYQGSADAANWQMVHEIGKALATPADEAGPARGWTTFDPEAITTGRPMFGAGGPLQVPEAAARRLMDYATIGDYGRLQKVMDVWKAATNTAKAAILPLRPAWWVAHAQGDLMRALIGSSPLEGGGGLVRGTLRLASPEWRAILPADVAAHGVDVLPPGRSVLPYDWGGDLSNRHLRGTAAGRAATYPIRAGYGVAGSLMDTRRALLTLDNLPSGIRPEEVTPDMMAQAVARTNDVLGNYAHDANLGPLERKWVKPVLPFYPFLKDSFRAAGALPLRYPAGTDAVAHAGTLADNANRQAWEDTGTNRDDLPEWLANGWPVAGGAHKEHETRVLLPGHWNPFTAVLDATTQGPADVLAHQVNPAARWVMDYASPPDYTPKPKPAGSAAWRWMLGGSFQDYNIPGISYYERLRRLGIDPGQENQP